MRCDTVQGGTQLADDPEEAAVSFRPNPGVLVGDIGCIGGGRLDRTGC